MIKLKISKLDSNACGVARADGKVVLIDKVIPDEIVEIYEKEIYPKYSIATKYSVIKSSHSRIKPQCPYYQLCGGCVLQHVDSEFEKDFKIKKVRDALKHITNIDIEIDEYIDSNKRFDYRNKIVFAIKDNKCGMYASKGRQFIDIDKCLLISNKLNTIYNIVQKWISNQNVKNINHVALREIKDNYQIVLIGIERPNIANLVKLLEENNYYNIQIVFNNNDAKKDLITNKLEVLFGDTIYSNSFNIKYPVTANSFMQINSDIADQLYTDVIDNIGGEYVINAYSGAGVLSGILSQKSKHVFGVEIVKNAHLDAEQLKLKNNIKNLTNICGKAECVVPKILLQGKNNYTLVVDPPRSGVNNELIKIVNDSNKISKIVYVSCNPNSLASNLRKLTNYRIQQIKLFNMFPLTSHVETLVVLERI